MGIAPGQTPPPPGTYVFPYTSDPNQGSGSVHTVQANWTATTIKQGLGAGGGVVNSFSNAQAAHNTQVKGRFSAVEDAMDTSQTTLGVHENRIIKLENGDQIAPYYSNDIWHKPMQADGVTPSMVRYAFISLAGGGGGARSQPVSGSGDRTGWYGGAQGGFNSVNITEASGQIDTNVDVYVGAGGAGAPQTNNSVGANGSNGSNSYFQDSGGAFSVAGGGNGGSTSMQTRGSGNDTDFQANGGQGWGYVGGEIQATAGSPGYWADGGNAGAGGTGTSNPGGNGNACPGDKIGPGGGGGGGGPYSTGGAGGFPAGGGGAGGCNGAYDPNAAGPGGPGSIGFCVAISYPT